MNPQWKPTNHRIRNQTFTGWQARFPTTRRGWMAWILTPAKLAYWPNKCGRFNLDGSTPKPSKPSWMCFKPLLSTTFSMAFITKKVSRLKGSLCHGQHHRTWGLARVLVPVSEPCSRGPIIRRIMKPRNVENTTRAMFWDCDECHLAMPVFCLTSESLIPSDVEDVVVDNWWCK